MKELSLWLDIHKMTQADLAKGIGYSSTYLSLVIQGHRPISLKTALAIQKFTEGDIKARDWPGIKEIYEQLCH